MKDSVEGRWRDWNHARKYSRWLELDEGDPGFQLLTEEEIAADVIKVSAMEEESDNELD
jgi:hypothetical protein